MAVGLIATDGEAAGTEAEEDSLTSALMAAGTASDDVGVGSAMLLSAAASVDLTARRIGTGGWAQTTTVGPARRLWRSKIKRQQWKQR